MILTSVFFYFKIIERNIYIANLIATVQKKNKNPNCCETVVLAIARAIYNNTNKPIYKNQLDLYDKIEAASFFNMTTATALKYGTYDFIGHKPFGPCGPMSRVLLNALWHLKIPARKLQLLDNEQGKGGGHTMIEFRCKNKWCVISVSDGAFVWRKRDGEVATAQEIKKNYDIFRQIYIVNPNYPYLFDNYKNIRWKKLPEPLVKLTRCVMTEDRFNKIQTPRLYDMPRTLFFIISLLSSTPILFVIIALHSHFELNRKD